MSLVQGAENDFKPYDSMVMEAIRVRAGKQYPALLSALFLGASMTAVKPFSSFDGMWVAFEMLATKKNPRSVGKMLLFGLLQGAFRKLCAITPQFAPAQQPRQRSSNWSSGSARNRIVIYEFARNALASSSDPF